MREYSEYEVWLYPEGSDLRARRMVDCAQKILHGEPEETPNHRRKREELQQFCSGLDFSRISPAPGFFNESELDDAQRGALQELKDNCSPDQRTALDQILSNDFSIHMIQGPPGTGKTTFVTDYLLPIFAIFGKKVNCYCPSDAATDVLARKIDEIFKAIRYHGLTMEWNTLQGRYPGDTKKQASKPPPKDKPRAALCEEDADFFRILVEFVESDPWNFRIKNDRPNLHSISIYSRALQFVGIMRADGSIPKTMPEGIRGGFEQWAQHFYNIDKKPEEKAKAKAMDAGADDDDKATYRQLTLELFSATLKDAKFVVTTCSNAADKLLRNATEPEIIIIDEAGMSKELESLMPIYFNLGSAKKVIFLGDHKQLRPPVMSLNRKLVGDSEDGLPFNIFGPQLTTPLMSRQIENGMPYVMFKTQFRMTAGIEELCSKLCYGGLLRNGENTRLADPERVKSLQALQFIKDEFGEITEIPEIFLNVPNGVCLRGRTKSRSNAPNVVIDMFIVQAVFRAGLFKADDIRIITPYKDQASLIREALWKAGSNDEFWLARGIRNIRVHTIDSMQGGEAPMVIIDNVLAKLRKGNYGFMINRGRINVSVSRAQFFQVFVGDIKAIDPPKKDANNEEHVPPPAVPDEDSDDDEEVDYWESTMRPVKLLYDHYEKHRVVVDLPHEEKPQRNLVDLTASNAFLAKVMAKGRCYKCDSTEHISNDCDKPDAKLTCRRCQEVGHRAANCTKPRDTTCHECKEVGHIKANCPSKYTSLCSPLLNRATDCYYSLGLSQVQNQRSYH